jgi:hypothetical protein
MTKVKGAAAIFAAAMLVAQPCAATEFGGAQEMQRQSSAFGGLNVRLPLGGAHKAKPTARLQLTTSRTFREERTGFTQTFRAQGLEIGGAKGGKPTLYLNGQSTADMQKKLGIGGTGKTLLIVGGVVLVLVIVVAASSFSVFPECEAVGGNDDHCID